MYYIIRLSKCPGPNDTNDIMKEQNGFMRNIKLEKENERINGFYKSKL